MKFKILIIAIVIIGVFVLGYKFMNKNETAMALVTYVTSHLDSGGDLVDYHEDIGVHSIDDIGYKQAKDGVILCFGKINIPINSETLSEDGMISKLNQMGIKVYKDKDTGSYFFEYKGEKVVEWVS